MRALVVGGAGFLGSHLTDRLLAEGHQVDVVDDLSTGSLANLSEARAAGGVKVHTLDVTGDEFATLVALREPEVVYHLAFLPPGEPPELVGAAAIAGLLAVVGAARALGSVKVVLALSAVSLYGDVPGRDQPVKEGRPWNPVGLRGVLGRTALDVLSVYREQYQVEFTALALGNVYGRRQRPEGGVVAAFAAARRERITPMVHGDGRQTRDFVFVDDAVDAMVRAAGRGGGLVVNVGTGVATSVRDVWDLLTGPDGAPPAPSPRREPDVTRLALSPTRARIHLAWAPWTDLPVGLRALS